MSNTTLSPANRLRCRANLLCLARRVSQSQSVEDSPNLKPINQHVGRVLFVSYTVCANRSVEYQASGKAYWDRSSTMASNTNTVNQRKPWHKRLSTISIASNIVKVEQFPNGRNLQPPHPRLYRPFHQILRLRYLTVASQICQPRHQRTAKT